MAFNKHVDSRVGALDVAASHANSNRGVSTQVSAVIFGFLNVARALVPVRIVLTLGTAPLVDKYIVQRFGLDKKKEEGADA